MNKFDEIFIENFYYFNNLFMLELNCLLLFFFYLTVAILAVNLLSVDIYMVMWIVAIARFNVGYFCIAMYVWIMNVTGSDTNFAKNSVAIINYLLGRWRCVTAMLFLRRSLL